MHRRLWLFALRLNPPTRNEIAQKLYVVMPENLLVLFFLHGPLHWALKQGTLMSPLYNLLNSEARTSELFKEGQGSD